MKQEKQAAYGRGYMLHAEVRQAPAALVRATQLGVRSYCCPDMATLPNKDAVIVLCFGTTHTVAAHAGITPVVRDIQAAYPHMRVEIAFTSHIVVSRLARTQGRNVLLPAEALQKLRQEGYTRVLMISLDIIPGVEYAYKLALWEEYKTSFKQLVLSTPLLYWMGQEAQRDDIADFIRAMEPALPPAKNHGAVLWLAHGTPHPANAYYSVIQLRLQEILRRQVYLYSVEGWPNLASVLPVLRALHIQTVTLMPLMLVAGEHARNDMATADRRQLERAGFHVRTYLHGLGENEAVRRLFLARVREARDYLHDEA